MARNCPWIEIIEQLNVIAGANGIGKIDLFEDGIMGLKSREIYEAPAATLLLKVHRDLEQFCLTKEEIRLKRPLEAQWAKMVYHGEWFHPLKDALDAFIATTQKAVNGEYVVELYKGNINIVSRSSQQRPVLLRRAFDQERQFQPEGVRASRPHSRSALRTDRAAQQTGRSE